MSTKNFSSFENLVNLFTNLSNKLKTKVENASLKDTVGFSVKNILNCDIESGSHTKNGLTIYVTKYIDNTISSIKVSGTATANTYIEIASLVSNNEYGELVGDNYILSGCPEGGSSSTYSLLVEGNFGSSFSDYGDGVLISNTIVNGKAYIVVKNGYTANNLYFYPMIRNKYVKDNTYERYYENVISRLNKKANLTDLPDLSNLVPQIQLKDTVGWTGKNILPPYVDASGKVSNGITFTVDNDGVITANGTATAEANFRLYNGETNDKHPFIGKNVILSGCPSGGSLNTYYISGYRVATQDGSGGTVTDIGNGVTFDYLNNGTGTKGRLDVIVKSGVTVNNVKFYPMLRYSEIADSTFEPYHESVDIVKANRNELIESVGYTGKNLAYNFIRTLVYNKAKLIKENNGFRVSMFEAKTWGTAQIFYDKLPENTDFIFSCDVVITSGRPIIEIWGRPEIKNTGGTKLIDSYPLDGSHISLKFNSYTYKYISISLLASDNTSANGNILYDNFMIRDACNIDDAYEDKKEIVEQSIKTDRTILKNTIGWVTKNLVHIRNTVGSETRNNISFIVNKDSNGELLNIVVNGTAGNSSELKYITADSSDGFYHLENGKEYILSGAPQGSSNEEGCFLILQDTVNWTTVQDLGQGARFIADGTKPYRISVCVAAGKTIDNAVFYPMLCPADIADDTYEPYHESVDYVKANRDEVKDVIGWSGKNLLDITLTNIKSINTDGTWNGNAYTKNGITYTVLANSDDKVISITTNGTASARGWMYLQRNVNHGNVNIQFYNNNVVGDYIFSDGVNTGIVSDKFVYYNKDSKDTYLLIGNGVTVTNLVWQPMIRKADIADGTFEPYHESVEQTLRDAEVIEGKNKFDTYATEKENNAIASLIQTDNSVRAIVSSPNQYTAFRETFTNLEKNADYILSDYARITRGRAMQRVEGSNDGSSWTKIFEGNALTSNGSQTTTFNTSNYTYIRVRLFLTGVLGGGYDTADITYENILLCLASEGSDYEPYYIPLKDSKFDRAEQRVLGAKNLLPTFENLSSQTKDGITYTVNSDGTILINGTNNSSGWSSVVIVSKSDNPHFFDNYIGKKLKLTGTLDINRKIQFWCTSNGATLGDGTPFVIPNDIADDGKNFNIVIQTAANQTWNNYLMKPMLTLASDPDDTYAPYAMTNKELTDVKFDRAEQRVLGAKNRLRNDKAVNRTDDNFTVTVTRDSNGNLLEIDVNGTPSSSQFIAIANSFAVPSDDNYILSGCPKGGSRTTYAIRWNMGSSYIYDVGEGVLIPKDTGQASSVEIRIESGYACNHLKFYPMLRLASDPDDTYAPYAMTNRELTQEVTPTLTADGTVVKSITDASVKVIPSHKIAFINLDLKIGTFATWSDCVSGLPKPSTNVAVMGIDRDSGKFVVALLGKTGKITFIRAEANPAEDHGISVSFAYTYNSLT